MSHLSMLFGVQDREFVTQLITSTVKRFRPSEAGPITLGEGPITNPTVPTRSRPCFE